MYLTSGGGYAEQSDTILGDLFNTFLENLTYSGKKCELPVFIGFKRL